MDPIFIVVFPIAIAACIVVVSTGWFIRWLGRDGQRGTTAREEQPTEHERIAAQAALDQRTVTAVDLDDWNAWLEMEDTR